MGEEWFNERRRVSPQEEHVERWVNAVAVEEKAVLGGARAVREAKPLDELSRFHVRDEGLLEVVGDEGVRAYCGAAGDDTLLDDHVVLRGELLGVVSVGVV